MKSKIMVVLFGAVLTLTACGGGDDTAQEETTGATAGGTTEVSDGEKLYQQSCANCHGGNLQGNIGPALQKVGSKYSEEEILHIIHEGQGSMPKGILQGADADAVAAWLSSMK
ncbi:cytochrome c551 [Bacillus pinisoli]|uniref:cytochrome c551 n=1 Tax=Bacillus pinisoli TaxID=2901866 RepID=UPI001FF5150E|nr:cytochrome c [Bacillus pinisoli]